MKVSIALATFNGAKYLEEQLASFCTQTRMPDEVVICDDCSTDATIDIITSFSNHAPFTVRVVRGVTNVGFIRNFEKALGFCTGDIIFLSDQDDVWYDTKISNIIANFKDNRYASLVINDADYADENLKLSGVTVLEKVVAVGGMSHGHIAGACTALTSEFLDFLLPFPQEGCPAHDVYIHRWSNLIGGKVLVNVPQQAWRIHGQNTTAADEMANPEIVSVTRRYFRTRRLNVVDSFIKKAVEFRIMAEILEDPEKCVQCANLGGANESIRDEIRQIVSANFRRSELKKMTWICRKLFAIIMMINGQYRHFKGYRSFLKDFLV